jgi:glycosyltransferase involved in cell wall biosynthesis
VPVGDAGALADACLRVIENPMLAGALGRRGRETALEWSWERVARETAGFYRRLIDMQ